MSHRKPGRRLSGVLIGLALGWLLLLAIFAWGPFGAGLPEARARALAAPGITPTVATATATVTVTVRPTIAPSTPTVAPTVSTTPSATAGPTVTAVPTHAAQGTATPAPTRSSSSSASSSAGGYSSSNANINSAPSGPQPTKVVFAEPTFAASTDPSGGLTDVAGGANSLLFASALGCGVGVLGLVIAAIALTVLLRGGYGPFLRQLVLGKRAERNKGKRSKRAKKVAKRGSRQSRTPGNVENHLSGGIADDHWGGLTEFPQMGSAPEGIVDDAADLGADAGWKAESWEDVPAATRRRSPSRAEWQPAPRRSRDDWR